MINRTKLPRWHAGICFFTMFPPCLQVGRPMGALTGIAKILSDRLAKGIQSMGST